MSLRCVKKILAVSAILIGLVWQVTAQTENILVKDLPNNSKVYLKKYTVTEYRSRPRDVNKDVPESEIFDNQKWTLKRYILTMKNSQSGQESTLWEYGLDLSDESKKFFEGFNIEDVQIGDKIGYILFRTYSNIYVIRLVKKNESWRSADSQELAKSYETQPILESKFEADKPEINIKYYTNKQKYGLWKWKLKNNRWRFTGNKFLKEESEK